MNEPTLSSSNARTVYLETFGCQMNVLDSQLVRGQLLALGYRFIDQWSKADVILFNTCSVREHAEQKVYSRVGLVGVHKQTSPHVVLGVIGCMAERQGVDIQRQFPQIDMIVGPGELDKVPLLINNIFQTDPARRRDKRTNNIALQGNTHRRSSTLAAAEDQLEMLDLSRSFDPDEHQGSAYVRITRGCNKFCTYCVVPQTRGAEVHRPPENILEECKKLVDAGVQEITLLGQTVNHYHFDNSASISVNGLIQPQIGNVVKNIDAGKTINTKNAQHTTTFAMLLAMIHDEIPTLKRLRFVTNYPRDFGDDILQVMRDRPRICRFLHLPVQSGSNRILKLMNRDYTVEEFYQLLDRARSYLPDAQIASDIICGFPTETEEDHQATMELLKKGLFKNSFIFKYSPRPGTTAIDRFKDDVPEDVKRRRNNELLAVQTQASIAVHNAMIGQTVSVFVESISEKIEQREEVAYPGTGLGTTSLTSSISNQQSSISFRTQLVGRTGGDLIVCFQGDETLVGSIVNVTIERATPLTLFGQVAAEKSVLV